MLYPELLYRMHHVYQLPFQIRLYGQVNTECVPKTRKNTPLKVFLFIGPEYPLHVVFLMQKHIAINQHKIISFSQFAKCWKVKTYSLS